MTEVLDWTSPGAYEVAAGVHRMPLPLPGDGLRSVNAYALDRGDSITLIDPGWGGYAATLQHLQKALASIGREIRDVTTVLVTHVHRDHYTFALELRRLTGARVHLGLGERPNMELLVNGRSGAGMDLRLFTAGAHELQRRVAMNRRPGGSWEYPDEWIEPGELVKIADRLSLRVVPTPGHTRGHIAFHDPERGLLFSGDHILPHITPSIGFEAAPVRSPLASYLSSLSESRALPDAVLLPAHGPACASAHGRIDELLAHHDERLSASLSAVTGECTAYDVAQRLRWTRRLLALSELDDFNQMLAVNETLAHLDVLVARGNLTRTEGRTALYRRDSSEVSV